MSLSSLNLIRQTVFELESRKRKCGRTYKRTKNGQMNGGNYTNFERNLAMMVIHVPVKLEFDWTNRFRVKSPETKMWTDRWMDKRTNERTELHQYRREPSYDGDLCPCQV